MVAATCSLPGSAHSAVQPPPHQSAPIVEEGRSTPDPLQELQRADAILQALARRRVPDWSPEADAYKSRIRRQMDELMDYEVLSRRALGDSWTSLRPAQRADFASTLAALVDRAYIDVLTGGGDYRVALEAETIDGDQARVTGFRYAKSAGRRIPIAYSLIYRQGRWRIADVVIDGIGLVESYKREFDRLVRRQSFDGLLAIMKERLHRPAHGE
ncbi:MAG TPA: ABC transporter substrate-binding protein [Polyangia bacterium]|nr:ABC transporter substrate-binding protein [Polyangia bacterium]